MGTVRAQGYVDKGRRLIAVRLPKDTFERVKSNAVVENKSIQAKLQEYVELGLEYEVAYNGKRI